jgi:hypothetical protein
LSISLLQPTIFFGVVWNLEELIQNVDVIVIKAYTKYFIEMAQQNSNKHGTQCNNIK